MMERLRRDDQRGFTLVELLVVLLLLGIVGGIVGNAVITSFRSSRATTNRTVALHELEIALQRMTRDLRAADPLVLSSGGDYDRQIGAWIDRDGTREIVRYEIVEVDGNQQLIRVDTNQTLVSLVDNGGEPVFRYLDEDGEQIECTTDCSSAYLRAARVEIRLVREIPNREPVRAITSVGVRGMRFSTDEVS
jgi:prepilin-type N-terminal cleavage/methylation domain-containing protein